MNEFIKKNINIIIAVFVLLGPILDLITGVCLHSLGVNLTIGIITRVLFLGFICIITLFTFKKKNILIPYLIIGLYFILYIVGMISFKDTNLFVEIQNLVKVFYFPILLISMYSIRDEIKISNMTLFTVMLLYLILIFVPTIFIPRSILGPKRSINVWNRPLAPFSKISVTFSIVVVAILERASSVKNA